jgi:superoxide reductase
MTAKKKIYYCRHCHNVIESLWDGRTDVFCCAEAMTELKANKEEAAVEKHIPVIQRDGNKVTVRVGDVAHPMTEDHYILFVEVYAGEKVYRHDFNKGDERAEAVFLIEEQNISARAFCNLHGLWATD